VGSILAPATWAPEVQVRACGPTRRSHRPQGLSALDALTFDDRDRVEMEVGGVESEAVVEDDEPPWEEELADQSDLAAFTAITGVPFGAE